MNTFFVTRVTKRISRHGVFFISKQILEQHSTQLCSFCNTTMHKYVKYYQIRTNSTVNILQHSKIKKKIEKKPKKYTELLTVTNKSISSKVKKVQEMTPLDLPIFAGETNSTISQIHDFKSPLINVSDTESIAKDFETLDSNEFHLNIQENHDELPEVVNEHIYNDANFINNTLNKNNKTGNKRLKPKINTSLEGKKDRPDSRIIISEYHKYLIVQMQIYIQCGLLDKANQIFMKYRDGKYRVTRSFRHSDLYNVLLEAYAFMGNTEKVLELYDIMISDSLKPSPETFSYVFDALGRGIIDDQKNAMIKKFSREMDKYGISLADMFNKTRFRNNQKRNVLKAVKVLMPNYEPSYDLANMRYTCKLLNESLTRNNCKSPVEGVLTLEELKSSMNEQLKTESEFELRVKNIAPHNQRQKDRNKYIAKLEEFWRNMALKGFERDLMRLKLKERNSSATAILYPFLELLDKEVYIDAILKQMRIICRGSENFTPCINILYCNLGNYIYKKYQIQAKKQSGVWDKTAGIYSKYLEWYLNPKSKAHLFNMNDRAVWQLFEFEETKYDISIHQLNYRWPQHVITDIGRFLYKIMLHDLVIEPKIIDGLRIKFSIPAIYTLFRSKDGVFTQQIRPHPMISELYQNSYLEELTFSPDVVPSYCPSRPWTLIDSGGYVMTKTTFLRIMPTASMLFKLRNTPAQQLYPIFDSLTQLGSIPWRINNDILNIVLELFQNGGSQELNIPQPPSVLIPPDPVPKNASVEEKRRATQVQTMYKNKYKDMYSLWCEAQYLLSLANHFRDRVFWFPHNLDFRGRAYPLPPHLTHLSSDVARSLLLFAKGKPLGPNGLDWLKIHLINLTDFKKGTCMQERLEFANENIDNILDSAEKPLTGKMWWAKSEEPWQTLAACMEVANALKSSDPTKYVGRFPVHQDGSCNGLQHYAALGRDTIGAQSVNLYPYNVPKDVYSEVLAVVEKQRQIDEENGVEIAKVLKGFMKRKVIKQTVMTTVYGVTRYGAQNQIMDKLRDYKDFPVEHIPLAARYLTDNTFNTIRAMFKSAREIQDWFTSCARVISYTCGEEVEWVTPLGLPVIQPYVKKGNDIKDNLKHKNAFAPNFIHSLDSTHMMLTSLHCNQAGVTFASVHDCFWTHPCTVDVLNRICREQFVTLHSEPILENLAAYFIKRYEPAIRKLGKKEQIVRQCLTTVPAKGDFDIKNVLSSVYFFN